MTNITDLIAFPVETLPAGHPASFLCWYTSSEGITYLSKKRGKRKVLRVFTSLEKLHALLNNPREVSRLK